MDSKPCHVVLGATGGIGSELCRQLRASGANVVAASRNFDTLRELVETTGVRLFTLDATHIEQVAACLADAQKAFGRVDGIANCIGSLLLGEPSDVAAAMAWLLDPAHSWITGQVFGIDGGLATLRTRGKS